jgi:hypothetical protein
MRATSVIFKKMPKVKKWPLGVDSPNLVTLTATIRDETGTDFS